MTQEQLNEAE